MKIMNISFCTHCISTNKYRKSFRLNLEVKNMNQKQNIKKKFDEALQSFIEHAKEDRSILAAILFGSLIEGNVWEKSDIDIILISNDEKNPYKFYWLDENGLNFQVTIYS